jgi:F-type H+-transporting ATPase subunit b
VIEFLLLVCLIILFVALYRPFKQHVLGGLDARAERIRQELDDAQRLHEEAKALLAKYQRQLHEGEALAKEIVEKAEAEQKRLEARMKADLDELIKRRTRQAEERIAQEEARAVQEVRARAADLGVRATRRLLEAKLEGEEVKKVMQSAIDEVGRKLA